MRNGLSGLSTCGLNAIEREMNTPPTPQLKHGAFTFNLFYDKVDAEYVWSTGKISAKH